MKYTESVSSSISKPRKGLTFQPRDDMPIIRIHHVVHISTRSDQNPFTVIREGQRGKNGHSWRVRAIREDGVVDLNVEEGLLVKVLDVVEEDGAPEIESYGEDEA